MYRTLKKEKRNKHLVIRAIIIIAIMLLIMTCSIIGITGAIAFLRAKPMEKCGEFTTAHGHGEGTGHACGRSGRMCGPAMPTHR